MCGYNKYFVDEKQVKSTANVVANKSKINTITLVTSKNKSQLRKTNKYNALFGLTY